MTEKIERVSLLKVENSFFPNLFCWEDKLTVLKQERRIFAVDFIQVDLALSCNKGG